MSLQIVELNKIEQPMKYLIIALLWSGYCALHSYLISVGFTNALAKLLKKYYAFYRLFYNLISLVLIIPLLKYTNQIDSAIIISYGLPLTIVRYFLIAASILIFLWAFFIDYDSLFFFGIRQIINQNRTKSTESSEGLKKKGLLGIVRHPMYFALIIYLWCQTFTLAGIVVNIVLTIYIFVGTWLEEKKLVMELGETYRKYQEEVPMIIPFTKRRSL